MSQIVFRKGKKNLNLLEKNKNCWEYIGVLIWQRMVTETAFISMNWSEWSLSQWGIWIQSHSFETIFTHTPLSLSLFNGGSEPESRDLWAQQWHNASPPHQSRLHYHLPLCTQQRWFASSLSDFCFFFFNFFFLFSVTCDDDCFVFVSFRCVVRCCSWPWLCWILSGENSAKKKNLFLLIVMGSLVIIWICLCDWWASCFTFQNSTFQALNNSKAMKNWNYIHIPYMHIYKHQRFYIVITKV